MVVMVAILVVMVVVMMVMVMVVIVTMITVMMMVREDGLGHILCVIFRCHDTYLCFISFIT